MIYRAVTILFFLLLSICLKAQYDYRSDDNHRFQLNTEGQYYLTSNALSGGFTGSYLYGKQIDNQRISKEIERITGKVRIGGELSFQLQASWFPDTVKQSGWLLHLSENSFLGSSLSPDFMRFILKGNKQFEGDTAIFDGSKLRAMRFQSFMPGYFKQWENKGYNFSAGLMAGVTIGSFLHEAEIKNAYLYTADYGEFIDAELNFRSKTTDTLSTGLFPINGTGASLSFFLKISEPKKHSIALFVENAGIIWWEKEMFTINKDTSLHFSGLKVENIMKIDSAFAGNILNDSVWKSYMNTASKMERRSFLPMQVSLMYDRQISRKIYLSTVLAYRMHIHKLPQLNIMASWSFGNIVPAVIIQAGGYGKIHAGAEIKLSTANLKHRIKLGTAFLDSHFFQNKSGGQGFYIGYAYNIKR